MILRPALMPQAFYANLKPQGHPMSLGILGMPPTTFANWLIDSRAFHHIANDLHNLFLHFNYNEIIEIIVGNDKTHPITHTGSTILTSLSKYFLLNIILCVPKMTKNLFSIFKFCKATNVSIKFFSNHFLVKDL